MLAVADDGLRRRPDGKMHFVRSPAAGSAPTGAGACAPPARRGRHQLAATAAADGLAVLPDGDGVGARWRRRRFC